MSSDWHDEIDLNDESVVDRRTGVERRHRLDPDPESGAELGRRRGPGRRRTDWTRAAEEGELTNEQYLFLRAIDDFKRENGKSFPTWTDVLEVVRLLGYRKTERAAIDIGNAQDWSEAADAPHGVRDKPGHRENESKRAA